MKRLYILLILTILSLTASAQGIVKGVVFDESNGESVPFANVTLVQGDSDAAGAAKSNLLGCATDINGFFLLSKVPADSLPHKETLSLAVMYLDYDMSDRKRNAAFPGALKEITKEYISSWLKRRDDKYAGPIGGYSPQYYEDSYNRQYYQDFGVYTTAAQRRRQNFGETRSITFTRVTDKRDNVFFPRKGQMSTLSIEQAGFGGDFNFTKLFGEYRYYIPQKNNVIAMDVQAGYAWGDLPLSQRFALGGASLRGYEEDQYRGNSMLKGTVEYRVPISKKFTVLSFVDAGYAWDKRDEKRFDLSKIKVGYGVGIRFNTPIGPVKLDYGWGEDRGRFHFSFGNQF